MDGVHYDAQFRRIYMTGGRWYGTPEASRGWIYVYQQKDADHYYLLAKVPGSFRAKTGIFVSELNRYYLAVPHHEKQMAEVRVYKVIP